MRPFETLMFLANLVAFFGLAFPLSREIGWLRYLTPVALLIAIAQALVEGPRWQLVPAYALAGLLFLAWLLQAVAPAGTFNGPSWIKPFAVGLGGLALAASAALPVILPVFRFPRPTGPHEIGTLTYHWVDKDRPEIFSKDSDPRRELVVQIWYPAKANPTTPRAPYLEDAGALASAFARVQHKPAFLFSNLKYITSNAVPAAPVAEDEPSYPVLIFLEGVTGFRQMNTYQVEELVSHGYIVVAIDQPYFAAVVVFPDGRQAVIPPINEILPLIRQSYLPADRAPVLNGQAYPEGIINYLAQDVIFTLHQLASLNQADPNGILTGRLDLQRAGTFGMSGGGIVAGEACKLEPRLQACLILDAPMSNRVVQEGLQQPAMWITREADIMRLERERAGGWPEAEIQAHLTSMRAVYESLPGAGYFVEVDGIFHSNFTDVPLWSPLFSWVGATGPLEAQRGHSIINAYSLAFFDRHLKGLPAPLLDGPAKEYPEVTIETRQPVFTIKK